MMDFEITRAKVVIALMLIAYAFGCWLHILILFDPKHYPQLSKLREQQGSVLTWIAAIAGVALWPILELWVALKQRLGGS